MPPDRLGDRPLSILLVEDNPGDARLIREALSETGQPGSSLEHVENLCDGLARLEAKQADVVLLDLELPDASGLDGLERVQRLCPETPVVVLTGTTDGDSIRDALSRGAEDYVTKASLSPEMLARTLSHAVELHRFRRKIESVSRDLRSANNRLQLLADLDPLTELLNRRGLQSVLSKQIQILEGGGGRLVALLLDLDDFKRINDMLGHAVGDLLLKEIARRLRAALTTPHTVGRVGGDAFLVLVPDTTPTEARGLAERLRLVVSEKLIALSELPIQLTASVGMASVTPATPSIDEVLSQARVALRSSKRDGKNRVSFDDPGALFDASPLADIVRAVRHGDRLQVVKQPIVRLEDEVVVGYEMLSRLRETVLELPQDFFRVSMEADILTLVDHRCLRGCIAAAAPLPAETLRHVNVFPSTLIDIPVGHLLDAFPRDRVPGTYCVEISEQQIIGEPSHLIEPVHAFRREGILTAVDDVGFGNSCLESLIMLEPEIIKIDRKCVEGIARNDTNLAYLRRLLAVAETLGAGVVAEGIEDRSDLEVLQQLGVRLGQGFLWGPPT